MLDVIVPTVFSAQLAGFAADLKCKVHEEIEGSFQFFTGKRRPTDNGSCIFSHKSNSMRF